MSATGNFRPPLPGPVHQRGFTLFEVMVAVAILALISGIGFPALRNMLARQTLTAARGAVTLAVARARSEALRADRPVRVIPAEQGDRLLVSRIAAIPLPAGASVEWPRDGLVIFGDGSSNGGGGIVRAGASASRFAVDPATARLDFAS